VRGDRLAQVAGVWPGGQDEAGRSQGVQGVHDGEPVLAGLAGRDLAGGRRAGRGGWFGGGLDGGGGFGTQRRQNATLDDRAIEGLPR
jgi:hypothetical protein